MTRRGPGGTRRRDDDGPAAPPPANLPDGVRLVNVRLMGDPDAVDVAAHLIREALRVVGDDGRHYPNRYGPGVRRHLNILIQIDDERGATDDSTAF